MPQSLSGIRDRIHRKSHEYFTFDSTRRERAKWRMFYGATDALLDAGMAAAAYARSIASNPGVDLLVCYGFLQAIYVQQDAVWTLSRAVGLDWHPNMDARLKEIRDTRNRLTGHPALAGEKENPPRLSSAIIAYHDITPIGFRGHVYYDDGIQDIMVEVSPLLQDNEGRLAVQMQAIEKKMNEEERQFRIENAAQPFSSCFGNNFSYLMQRLHCDLSDEGRVVQAQTHAQMIRDVMKTLEDDLQKRGFTSSATSHPLGVIFTGLELLEKIIGRDSPSPDNQNEFDLIFDGVEKHVGDLKKFIAEIDAKLRTPV